MGAFSLIVVINLLNRGKMAKCQVSNICHFLLLITLALLSAAYDPYEVLGVDRQATGQEIKKAYKRLAREWHPDKNKSPEAESKFVQIGKAYELLTDDEKRRNYDKYGQTDDNPRGDRGRPGGFPFGGFSDFFGGRANQGRGFRGSPFSSFFDSEPDDLLINKHIYDRDVLPQSRKHLYLLFAYSDWCGNCKLVRKMFDQLHNTYKDKGIRFVTADADVDRSLVYKLGLSRVPAVLAIVNGKAILYKKREWSLASIEQFLLENLPYVPIRQILSKSDLKTFVDELMADNKPRVILYGDYKSPPNWLKILAFTSHKSHAFGYVSSRDYKGNVNEYLGENGMLAVYTSTGSPAERVSRGSTYATASSLVEKYIVVKFPRITNQVVFDTVCPTVTTISNRKYCVILVHPSISEMEPYMKQIEKMRKSGLPYVEKTTYSYISPDYSQYEFLAALNYSHSLKPQVAVLLRISDREAYFKWHTWASPHSFENIESFLMNVASGRSKLSNIVRLSQVVDNDAPGVIVQTLSKVWETITESLWSIFDIIGWMLQSEDGFIILSVLVMMLFIFGGSIVSAFSSVTAAPSGASNYQRRTLNKYSSNNGENSSTSSTSYRHSGGGEKFYSGRNEGRWSGGTLRHRTRSESDNNEEIEDADQNFENDEDDSRSPSNSSQASANSYGDVGNSCFNQ